MGVLEKEDENEGKVVMESRVIVVAGTDMISNGLVGMEDGT